MGEDVQRVLLIETPDGVRGGTEEMNTAGEEGGNR